MTPETLRTTRLSLGLTQTQLGARLGVTLRQIQRWEAGDIQIPRGFVVAVGLLAELDECSRVNYFNGAKFLGLWRPELLTASAHGEDMLTGCGGAWIEYSTADNCAALRQSDPSGNNLMLAFEAGWKARAALSG